MNNKSASEERVKEIGVGEVEAGAVLLDVRTGAEYGEVHVEGAELMPLSELDVAAVKRLVGERDGCVVVCRSGKRAGQAAEKLVAGGIGGVKVLRGGMEAWESAGKPVVRGASVMSLERQVRIAAGALVFVGSVLAWFVNPAWVALPGFVGAGLVFAGITDTCGMGMLIARMPWNTRRPTACCSAK